MKKEFILTLINLSKENRADVVNTLSKVKASKSNVEFREDKIRMCENLISEIDDTISRLNSQLAIAE